MQVNFYWMKSIISLNSKNSFLQSFVDYWDTKKEKLKVNLIEETNAVKVLTIHKSKGLNSQLLFYLILILS